MKETIYNKHIIPILEQLHVFNECDIIAKEISLNIKKLLNDIDFDDLIDYINESDFIYTGYNLNENYINDIRNNLNSTQFKLTNNENKPNPIYYLLIYNTTDRDMGKCSKRAILNNAVNINDNNSKIHIVINISKFITPLLDVNYLSITATIAHELQHLFDQYIIKDRNFILDNKNNIYYDFKKNILNISNKQIIQILDSFFYFISHNEQRGFLSELKTTLSNISSNKQLKNKLFIKSLYYMTDELGFQTIDKKSKFDESILINHILNTPIIKKTSRVEGLQISYNIIKKYKQTDIIYYNYLISVIGYYMLNHNMLKIKKYNVKLADLKNTLTIDNIQNKIQLNDNIFNTIIYSIKYEYARYLHIVQQTIKLYLHDIFNYEKFGNYLTETDIIHNKLTKYEIFKYNTEIPIILFD